jgi:hypothetical protein
MASLKDAGFTGFHTIADLWVNHECIPVVQGIYVVVRSADDNPVFLDKGTGGFFKGKEPNYSVVELTGRWITGCKVSYVGKAGGDSFAATLRSRIRQYLNFGKGKSVGHTGGRAIWQLA